MSVILDDVDLYALEQEAKLYGFPEYVKQADFLEVRDGTEAIPSASFADPRRRRFPCHTKAACWYSLLQVTKQAHDGTLSETERSHFSDRILEAARYFGNAADLTALQEKHASLYHEEELPDSQFMYVYQGDGNKVRRYPLTSPDQVKEAAAYLVQWRDHFPAEDRRQMADRLLRQAEKLSAVSNLGNELLLTVERLAGDGFYDPPEAATLLRNRVKAAKHCPPEMAEQLEAMAVAVESNPLLGTDPTTLHKFADTIDTFDRLHGLVGQYGPMLPRVEDVLFKHSYRQIDELVADSCETATGAVYRPDQLAKLSLADIRSLFGTEFAHDVSYGLEVDGVKMAELAATLPRPDAVLLDRAMGRLGEHPILFKESEVSPTRFTQEDWDNLALIDQALR